VAKIFLGVLAGLLLMWIVLVVALLVGAPKGTSLRDALRLLPDTLRLLRGLAQDDALPRGVRVRLWVVFAYLALPVDLMPDFIPVLGYADDAIVVALVLRSVVRKAGPIAVERHWKGSPDGLVALRRVAGF
jgi:uncharacterized membrane protein YkvA (DUF1232 family)